jgi:hypothetical protein
LPAVVYTYRCLCKRWVPGFFLLILAPISYREQQYGTLQFGKFEEIQKKGYHAAMDILKKWDEEGRLPSAYIDGKDATSSGKKKGRSARRNSI